jgi:hypothetical protein
MLYLAVSKISGHKRFKAKKRDYFRLVESLLMEKIERCCKIRPRWESTFVNLVESR